MDGSVDFYQNWIEYQHGFGNLNGEFWLGKTQQLIFSVQRIRSIKIFKLMELKMLNLCLIIFYKTFLLLISF